MTKHLKKITTISVGIFIVFLFFSNTNLSAQSVAVTDDETYTADSTAMLDVKSESKGLLIPRLTTLQRNGISNPAHGLLVYDSDEKVFYYYDGSSWVNLSIGQAWEVNSDYVYLSSDNGRVGIGTSAPGSKLEVKADNTFTENDTLFAVKDQNGNIVFAVFPDGAKVYVNSGAKGKIGGFAVSGRTATKATETEYLRVTPDSTRIYVNEDAVKGKIGGFAVSGRTATKGLVNDYLYVTGDSTRVYVNEDAVKGKIGGFAVSGRTATKGSFNDYLQVTKDSTRVYISESGTKGKIGGFAVSGRTATKGLLNDYFNVSGNENVETVDSDARILWYPKKEAFLTGRVLIESPDSVGTNSMATGFESKAIGDYSQAMGYMAVARGDYSTAIGESAYADTSSFAFGKNTLAAGIESYAFGSGAVAKGLRSFSFGSVGIDSLGNPVEDNPTLASGKYSISMGLGARAEKKGSMSFGVSSNASEEYALALGYGSLATGRRSIAIGSWANYGESVIYPAPFNYLHKNPNMAVGDFSMSIGSGNYSESGGTSIGLSNNANNWGSVALGYNNTTNADRSIAAGYRSEANGKYSTAIGNYATATAFNSFVIGSFNTITGDPNNWVDSDPLFVIGNGENLGSSTVRSNAFVVSKNGNATVYGNLYASKQIRASLGIYADSLSLGSYKGSMYNTQPVILMKAYHNVPIPTYTKEYGLKVSGRIFSIFDESADIFNIYYGKIGIGTVTPSSLLHLRNSGDAVLTIDADTDNSGEEDNPRIILTQDGGGIYGSIGFVGLSGQLFSNSITNSMYLISHSNSYLLLGANNTADLTINPSGNVGVGLTSPGYKLDVNGEITSRSNNAFRMRNTNYSAFWRNDGNDIYLLLTDQGDPDGGWNNYRPFTVDLANGNTSLSKAIYVMHDGDVSIGTSTYKAQLYVEDNMANIGAIRAESKYAGTSNHYAGAFDAISGTKGTGVFAAGSFVDFYAGGPGANYGPFTGSHEVVLIKDFPVDAKAGLIVSVTGNVKKRHKEDGSISISSTMPEVKLAAKENDKAVFGAFIVESSLPDNHWLEENGRYATVNALGEGRVYVTDINGNIEAGDYITTSVVPGYGQKQDDDLLHNYTLGKATENVNWSDIAETIIIDGKEYKVYLIAVVYTSG